MPSPLWIADLGTVPYRPCWALQQGLRERRAQGRGEDLLLLVEHPPVITLGRRGQAHDVLAPPEVLAALGIEVVAVDRGGQATVHGPGQVVGYPIVDLRARGLGPVAFVRRLEEGLIDALASLGITASRIPGRTGVWIGGEKIASLGLRISRGITMHGFALNVSTDLSLFSLIVPCGLPDAGVTSVERVMGRRVSVDAVKALVAQGVACRLEAPPVWVPADQVWAEVGAPAAV
jgi:lipoate-protein ligase B